MCGPGKQKGGRMSAQMQPREKFIVAQSIYKRIGKEMKTGKVGNARWNFESSLEDQYRATGAKSFDLRIGDTKVGTATRSVRRVQPKTELEIVDEESFRAWVGKNLTAFYQDILSHCVRTGEVPDGCAPVAFDATEKASWTLRGLDMDDVAEAVRATYGVGAMDVAGLIGDGE